MIKIKDKEYYIGDLDERNYAIKHINKLLQEPVVKAGTEGGEGGEEGEETSPPPTDTTPPPTPPAEEPAEEPAA